MQLMLIILKTGVPKIDVWSCLCQYRD